MAFSIKRKGCLKVEQALFCLLCGCSIERIHSLLCGHVFCCKCIPKGQPKDNEIRCPTCAAVSKADVDQLPDAHEARLLFKVVRAEEKRPDCVSCKRRKSDRYCTDCESHVCTTCVAKQHNTHRIQEGKKEYQLKCLPHKRKLEECTTCQCLLVKNGNLEDELEMRRDWLRQHCEGLELKEKMHSEWEQRLEELREERERARKAAHRSIDRNLYICMRDLRKQATELKQRVDREHRESEIERKTKEKQMAKRNHRISVLKAVVHKVLKQDVYLMANFHSVLEANRCLAKKKDIDIGPLLKMSTFQPNLNHKIGELQLSTIDLPNLENSARKSVKGSADKTAKELVLKRSIRRNGTAKPTGLTFLPNGDLAIAYRDANCIVIYDPSGREVRTLTATLSDNQFMPSGIASFKSDQIVACDSGDLQLKFFNINRSLQTPNRFLYKFHTPSGVSVSDRYIGVCDTLREQIVIFNYESDVLLVVDDGFKTPKFLAFHGSQIWASNGTTVRVYDDEGKVVDARQRHWDQPRDLAACSDGVVVVNSGERSVVLCGGDVDLVLEVVRSPRMIAASSAQKTMALSSAEDGRVEGVYVYEMCL